MCYISWHPWSWCALLYTLLTSVQKRLVTDSVLHSWELLVVTFNSLGSLVLVFISLCTPSLAKN